MLAVTNKENQSKIVQIIREKKLSSRKARKLIKDSTDTSFLTYDDHYIYSRKRIIKSFDKSIIALRIAIKKLGPIVEALEDDWIFYDILLHHKNMLNSQIDLLLREKIKYRKLFR